MYGYYIESAPAPDYYKCASLDDSIEENGGQYIGKAKTGSHKGPFCALDLGLDEDRIRVGAQVMERYTSSSWIICTGPTYNYNNGGAAYTSVQAYDANSCDTGSGYCTVSSHRVLIAGVWHDALANSPTHGSGTCLTG